MSLPVGRGRQRIPLASKPQLAEATRVEDDWTGITDAAARRRAQTRLNTRAYRKRNALAKKAKACSNSHEIRIKIEPLVDCWDEKQQSISALPASHIQRIFNAKTPLLPDFNQKDQPNIVFPLSLDHLILLLQYNALRATVFNRKLISTLFIPPLERTVDGVIHIIPYPTHPEQYPPKLLPTVLQQTVPHPNWIDYFPSPEGRDRLIRAIGTFDEDDLWADCLGGLYEGFADDEMVSRGIVAWSPPYDISGWEMTEGFLRKWGWLFAGLPGGLEATNRWRLERGEEPFDADEFPPYAAL